MRAPAGADRSHSERPRCLDERSDVRATHVARWRRERRAQAEAGTDRSNGRRTGEGRTGGERGSKKMYLSYQNGRPGAKVEDVARRSYAAHVGRFKMVSNGQWILIGTVSLWSFKARSRIQVLTVNVREAD